MPRLRRVDSTGPGIVRLRKGRGFYYVDEHGDRVEDPETLARIRTLVIPPAWRDVWISPHPMGHIQAVGTDAAGRRQYLYHERWRTKRDQLKFERMVEFARTLPALRTVVAEHIRRPGLGRERVLACATRMLDRGLFRIGTEQYAAQNQTYGVATILKRHVKVGPKGQVTFDYIAKGGKRVIQTIVDPEIAEVLAELKKRRQGKELLAYKVGRLWVDLRSSDINDYIKSITGGDYTAKDFRTWSATVLAAVALGSSDKEATSVTARKRVVAAAVREVAEHLGNTPAVARSSYIFPRVIDEYLSGVTIAPALEGLDPSELDDLALRGKIEEAVLALIEGESVRPDKVA
ncbi:MAG: DNA topoisomerase IB [Actinomycetota bacterium]|nr:DNA topoisomerase IB [Actinomycetota bacterium]